MCHLVSNGSDRTDSIVLPPRSRGRTPLDARLAFASPLAARCTDDSVPNHHARNSHDTHDTHDTHNTHDPAPHPPRPTWSTT